MGLKIENQSSMPLSADILSIITNNMSNKTELNKKLKPFSLKVSSKVNSDGMTILVLVDL